MCQGLGVSGAAGRRREPWPAARRCASGGYSAHSHSRTVRCRWRQRVAQGSVAPSCRPAGPWQSAPAPAIAHRADRPSSTARCGLGSSRLAGRGVAPPVAEQEQVEPLHLLSGPWRLEQNLQARSDPRQVAEATQGNALRNAAPAAVRHQLGEDILERLAMQRVARLGGRWRLGRHRLRFVRGRAAGAVSITSFDLPTFNHHFHETSFVLERGRLPDVSRG